MSRVSHRTITRRFLRVWQRNFTVYRRTWHINFLPPLLEPVLYVAAFGIGFKTLVPAVHVHGLSVSYVAFIAPALIAVGIMYNAFFETTYSSFVRMYYQKTFDAIMSAPVSLEEVITGEIVWGATKSLFAAVTMLVVLTLCGLVRYPQGLLVLPLAFLGGLGFAAIGMFFTGVVKSIELFNLPTFLFITPMFLFSGTFFPLDQLPGWAQGVAGVFPLTHVTALARDATFGTMTWRGSAASWGYLVAFAVLWFPVALHAMRRRLVR